MSRPATSETHDSSNTPLKRQPAQRQANSAPSFTGLWHQLHQSRQGKWDGGKWALSGASTYTGTRVLTLGGNTAANSSFSGNIILGTASQAGRGVTLTAASGGLVTFSGVIQNPTDMDATTYTVTKADLGTVVLSNTYTSAPANGGAGIHGGRCRDAGFPHGFRQQLEPHPGANRQHCCSLTETPDAAA